MFHPDLVPNRKHLFDKQNIANVYQTMFDKHCLINNVKGRLRVSGQERFCVWYSGLCQGIIVIFEPY